MAQLRNAPVVYVICQVRFSPVLRMSDYIPDIQEKLRKQFPVFNELTAQTLTIGPAGPEAKTETRWVMANEEQDSGFVLHPGFMAFMSITYSVFDDFIAKMRQVLETVGETVGLSLVTRIGLRYIDFIEPKGGLQLDDMIKPEYLGFRMADAERDAHQQDTFARSPVGKVRIRLLRGHHDSVLPPDLEPVLRVRAVPETGESIILDTDHFDEQSTQFDIDKICSTIDSLHLYTGKAFRAVVSDKAIEVWK